MSNDYLKQAMDELRALDEKRRQVEERIMRMSTTYRLRKYAWKVLGPVAVVVFFLLGVWLG